MIFQGLKVKSVFQNGTHLKWKELPNSTASEIETEIPTEYRIRNETVPPRISRNWNKATFPLLDRIWNKSIFTKMTSSESWLVITLMTPHFGTASWAPEPNQICKDLCPPSFQNGSLVPNVPSAITQPFFELQTPDFAWKFVWTVPTNYKKKLKKEKN